MKLRWMRYHDGSWTCTAWYRGRVVTAWSSSRRLATLDAVSLCYEKATLYA